MAWLELELGWALTILEHMVINCEDEEKEVNNEEEGEISCNLVLVKCHVCACEEVKNTFRDTE